MNGGALKTDENGQIVLSFGQATWMTSMVLGLVTLIIAVLGTWYDMRNRVDLAVALLERRMDVMEKNESYTRSEIDGRRLSRDKELLKFDSRIERLEQRSRGQN